MSAIRMMIVKINRIAPFIKITVADDFTLFICNGNNDFAVCNDNADDCYNYLSAFYYGVNAFVDGNVFYRG